MPRANPWIVRPRPNPGAALRLICFPFAGGGASTFSTWPAELPGNIEVVAVELPGRESRVKQPLFERLTPLVAALLDALDGELQPPFALLGHSMGGLLAFSVARALRHSGRVAPVHLFVSGRRAPQLPDAWPLYRLPRPALFDRLRQLGGIPERVLQNTELMAIFLPILLADIAVSEAEPIPAEPPLDTPITAFGGLDDPRTRLHELDAWRTQTTAGFDAETFPGSHFFLLTARTAVLGSLARRLAQITATAS